MVQNVLENEIQLVGRYLGFVLQNHSQIGPIQNDTYTSTTNTLTSALRSARAYDLTKLFPKKYSIFNMLPRHQGLTILAECL